MLGDIIHNLRSTLDALAYAVAIKSLGRAPTAKEARAIQFPSSIPRRLGFPKKSGGCTCPTQRPPIDQRAAALCLRPVAAARPGGATRSLQRRQAPSHRFHARCGRLIECDHQRAECSGRQHRSAWPSWYDGGRGDYGAVEVRGRATGCSTADASRREADCRLDGRSRRIGVVRSARALPAGCVRSDRALDPLPGAIHLTPHHAPVSNFVPDVSTAKSSRSFARCEPLPKRFCSCLFPALVGVHVEGTDGKLPTHQKVVHLVVDKEHIALWVRNLAGMLGEEVTQAWVPIDPPQACQIVKRLSTRGTIGVSNEVHNRCLGSSFSPSWQRPIM